MKKDIDGGNDASGHKHPVDQATSDDMSFVRRLSRPDRPLEDEEEHFRRKVKSGIQEVIDLIRLAIDNAIGEREEFVRRLKDIAADEPIALDGEVVVRYATHLVQRCLNTVELVDNLRCQLKLAHSAEMDITFAIRELLLLSDLGVLQDSLDSWLASSLLRIDELMVESGLPVLDLGRFGQLPSAFHYVDMATRAAVSWIEHLAESFSHFPSHFDSVLTGSLDQPIGPVGMISSTTINTQLLVEAKMWQQHVSRCRDDDMNIERNHAINASERETRNSSSQYLSDFLPRSIGLHARQVSWARTFVAARFPSVALPLNDGSSPHWNAMLRFLEQFSYTKYERPLWDEYRSFSRTNPQDTAAVTEAADVDGIAFDEYVARETLVHLKRFCSLHHIPIRKGSDAVLNEPAQETEVSIGRTGHCPEAYPQDWFKEDSPGLKVIGEQLSQTGSIAVPISPEIEEAQQQKPEGSRKRRGRPKKDTIQLVNDSGVWDTDADGVATFKGRPISVHGWFPNVLFKLFIRKAGELLTAHQLCDELGDEYMGGREGIRYHVKPIRDALREALSIPAASDPLPNRQKGTRRGWQLDVKMLEKFSGDNADSTLPQR